MLAEQRYRCYSAKSVGWAVPNGTNLTGESCGCNGFSFAFVFWFMVAGAGEMSAGTFHDGCFGDVVEELAVEVKELPWWGQAHLDGLDDDELEGTIEAQLGWACAAHQGCLGHRPAHEVVEGQLDVELLQDACGPCGAQVFDLECVFPLAVDGFDLPALMVGLDELWAGELPGIEQGGQQQGRAKARGAVADESQREGGGQVRCFAQDRLAGSHTDDEIVLAEALADLIGDALDEAHQEVAVCAPDGVHDSVCPEAPVHQIQAPAAETSDEVDGCSPFTDSQRRKYEVDARPRQDGHSCHEPPLGSTAAAVLIASSTEPFHEATASRQIERSAVDGHDLEVLPKPLRAKAFLEPFDHAVEKGLEETQWLSGPRLDKRLLGDRLALVRLEEAATVLPETAEGGRHALPGGSLPGHDPKDDLRDEDSSTRGDSSGADVDFLEVSRVQDFSERGQPALAKNLASPTLQCADRHGKTSLSLSVRQLRPLPVSSTQGGFFFYILKLVPLGSAHQHTGAVAQGPSASSGW